MLRRGTERERVDMRDFLSRLCPGALSVRVWWRLGQVVTATAPCVNLAPIKSSVRVGWSRLTTLEKKKTLHENT